MFIHAWIWYFRISWCLIHEMIIFSFYTAAFVSLRSIIMVELMGIERLTNAFGLVVLCQGLSSFMGSPIAGQWIYSSKTLVNIYARARVDVHYINFKKIKSYSSSPFIWSFSHLIQPFFKKTCFWRRVQVSFRER